MSAVSNASPGRLSGSLTPVRNEYSKALVAAGAGRGRFFDHEPETSEADLQVAVSMKPPELCDGISRDRTTRF